MDADLKKRNSQCEAAGELRNSCDPVICFDPTRPDLVFFWSDPRLSAFICGKIFLAFSDSPHP
jgi:hypothetical protein